jgi:signal peptidase I
MTVVRIGQPEPEAKPRGSLLRSRVTPGLALLVILGVVAFRLWVVETAIVEGRSMERTLAPGDHVLVLKLLGLKRFDVVVVTDPQTQETVIKRVVGLPGDTVSMMPRITRTNGREIVSGSQLYIDGRAYDEPYASSSLPVVLPPTRLAGGHYFLLGDNRDDSVDSRVYGPVPREQIHGVAVAIVYPFGRAHIIARAAEPEASAPSSASSQ